jgi:predicted metalloprotease with PDZ domain
LALLAALAAPLLATAQTPVRYEISFPNRAHHEAEIRVTFDDIGPGPLEVRMSRTSPGRYALHEFTKNVYAVQATGLNGRAVTVTRPDVHQWDITDHGGEVTLTYTLYGDLADGTYVGIDRTHGHLNMPATFMWARGLEARPIELTVQVPEGSGWRVATQLVPTDDPLVFTAPDLQYFMDSPTEVSDFWERSWEVGGPDGPQTIRVALHHTGSEADAERWRDAVEAIVEAERGIWGGLPRFDHGRYTFLADYLPWADGDGMEHRNSTVISNSSSIAENPLGIFGTVAHEFFHSWSMERMRPASLTPFDFEAANVSGELWFAEGFTSYFDDLALWRAGLIDDEEFAARMGGIADAVVNARGRRFYSPVGMSRQAPLVDAAVSVDPTNRQNTFLSYYTWGSGVALALDLTLRERFEGVTLEHLMRDMWRTHGSPELPYGLSDIEAALARTTGDPAFAKTFFDRYVRGREAPDYQGLLEAAGIELGLARPGSGWIGPLPVRFEDGAAVMTATPLMDTPLYAAGLDRGDRIVELGGTQMRSPEDLREVLGSRQPGERLSVRFESRGSMHEAEMMLVQDPTLRATLATDGGAGAEFRSEWKEAAR